MRIGELLTRSGLLDEITLSEALEIQTKCTTPMPIGQVLTSLHFLSERDLQLVLQAQRKMRFANMNDNLAVASLRWAKEYSIGFDAATQQVLSALQGGSRLSIDGKGTLTKLLSLSKLQELTGTGDGEKSGSTSAPLRKQSGAGPSFGGNPEKLMRDGDNAAQNKDWEHAQEFYEKARIVIDRSDGYEERDVEQVLVKLGQCLIRLRRFEEAEKIYLRLLDIMRKEHGDKHPPLRACLVDLADIYNGQNLPDKADPLYQRAMVFLQDELYRNPAYYLEVLRNGITCALNLSGKKSAKRLGDLLVEAKLLTEEQRLSALQESKRSRRPLGRTLVELNLIQQETLKLALRLQLASRLGTLPSAYAVAVLRSCVVLRLQPEQVVGVPELVPSPAQPMNTLSNELTQLIVLMDRLLSVENSFGPEHPDAADLAVRIGDISVRRSEFDEAELSYQRAHAIYCKSGEDYKLRQANVASKLGKLFLQRSKLTEAEPFLMEAMTLKQKMLGNDHNDVANAVFEVAELQFLSQNLHGAVGFYRSALAVKEAKKGAHNSELCPILERLALCFEQLDQPDMADSFLKRAKEIKAMPANCVAAK